MRINNVEAKLLSLRAERPGSAGAPEGVRPAAGAAAPPPQFDIRLGAQLSAMEKNRQGTIEHKPYSNSRTVGWLLVGLRRIARRLVLRQFAEETVNQQNRFNEAAFRSMELLGEQARYSSRQEQALAQQMNALSELAQRCARCEEQLARSNGELESLRRQLAAAESERRLALLEEQNRQLTARLESDEREALCRIERLEGQNAALLETVRTDSDLRSGEYSPGTMGAASRYLSRQQAAISASQAGEDGIICYLLNALGIPAEQRSYLDIGANHAVELSNTFRFYAEGASGVLVEANPFLADELRRMRPRDRVINRCIAAEDGAEALPFYILSGDGLSSCDRAAVDAALRNNPALSVESTVEVAATTIERLIAEYMPQPPAILNIDIEGMEDAVLRGIDWQRWRPPVVIVETVGYDSTTIFKDKQSEAVSFMEQQGYVEYAFTGINSIFADPAAFGKGGEGR